MTLEGYADWMKWLPGPLPDGRYELKAFAHDPERNSVSAFATFHGTHTGEGGPVPADRQVRRRGLRLRHGLRRRQDPAHDQGLELRLVAARTRLGLRREPAPGPERCRCLRDNATEGLM